MTEYIYGTDGHEGHWLTGEEIVRCRDCERFAVDQSDHEYRSGWWCHWWDTDMVEPDGFCKWGKRRTQTIKEAMWEGYEHCKQKFPNCLRMLGED